MAEQEKTLSELRRENIQLRAENEKEAMQREMKYNAVLMVEMQAEIEQLKGELELYKGKYFKAEADATNLTGELVSLMADVSGYQGSICCYCKNYNHNNCEHFGDLPKEDGIPLQCGKWEWRGANV